MMKQQRETNKGRLTALLSRALVAMAAATAAMTSAEAQNELTVSQYMHNYYAVNPSFAGSRECVSVAGSFRKQWATIESSPMSALVTAHTPMRRERITLGFNAYHQSIHQSTNSGMLFTVGYRANVINRRTWLGLAIQPGLAFRSRNWQKVHTMQPDDDVFMEKETGMAPMLGLGASLYSDKFFVGLSSTTLLVTDDFENKDTRFAPQEATWIAMGGYWFQLDRHFALQPSALVDFNKRDGVAADLSVSGIYDKKIWLSAAYRTTKDLTVGAAYKPNFRMKIAYNYSLGLGPVKSYSAGSHEISLQYDFVYRVRTVSHRFY